MDIAAAIAVFLTSSVKYMIGLFGATLLNMGLVPRFLLTVGGGIAGVIFFIYFGDWIKLLVEKRLKANDAKKFNWKNRMIVRIRQYGGLEGVAALTLFLSVPIGVALALSLSKDKFKIILYMFVSLTFWATIVLLPDHFFGFEWNNIFQSISDFFKSIF